MNFMDIKTLDIANGPGCRVSLFVSGCRRHCKECFNPESWDFTHGSLFTEKEENDILQMLSDPYIRGLSILGGEPFEEENAVVLLPFIKKVKKKYPEKDLWMYTGYTIEELYMKSDVTSGILELVDILVDGDFQIDKKDITLQYCGSTNQRVIDVQKTLQLQLVFVHDNYDFSKPIKMSTYLC